MHSTSRRIRLTLLACLFIVAGLLAALVAAGWGLMAALADPFGNRAHRIAIAFDQLMNAATGGNEDETISSRADRARTKRRRWGCLLCRLLDALDTNHCRNSRGV